MGREFIIPNTAYYIKGETIFRRKHVVIEPEVTVLVGCNGTGKSTLIREIESQLKQNKIKYSYFDNLKDGGENARSAAGFREDIAFLATAICSSEGENIVMNMANFAEKLGGELSRCKDKEYWILLDAIDSGLSVDNIIELKDLFYLILETNKDKDVYIVVSANEYELARNEQCFDVYNCKYITFKNYEDYRDFIIKSRKRKDKRCKTKD